MQICPRIAVTDLRGDVLVEVALIPEADAAGFLDEIASHLGPMLGLHREVARNLLMHHVRDGVRLPVPTCFELSATTRNAFAKDLAAVIAPYFRSAARSAA